MVVLEFAGGWGLSSWEPLVVFWAGAFADSGSGAGSPTSRSDATAREKSIAAQRHSLRLIDPFSNSRRAASCFGPPKRRKALPQHLLQTRQSRSSGENCSPLPRRERERYFLQAWVHRECQP